MGARGPVPKRSSERRRRNKGSKPDKVTAAGSVKAPAADSKWHPIAKGWFNGLKTSGQAQFFEPSDWQAARLVAEELNRYLRAKKKSAIMFAHIWSAMTDLLTTEGARRRVRLEVEREGNDDETPAGVTALDDYRKSLGAAR